MATAILYFWTKREYADGDITGAIDREMRGEAEREAKGEGYGKGQFGKDEN